MFVDDQHSTVTLYCDKLHVVKEAIHSSRSLSFITYFNFSVNAKTLTDFSKYFKDVIQTTIVNSVRCPLNRGF